MSGELGTDDLRSLLAELGEELAARGVHAHLFIVGGAAMALRYDNRRVTRDVDAVFFPTEDVRRAAAVVAERHNLDPDWLNDGAKGFMPGDDPEAHRILDVPSLTIDVGSSKYLLAMKLFSARSAVDYDDAVQLFIDVGFTTTDQALNLLEQMYSPALLTSRQEHAASEVAARAAKTTIPHFPQ
jgi:hypothetical protein